MGLCSDIAFEALGKSSALLCAVVFALNYAERSAIMMALAGMACYMLLSTMQASAEQFKRASCKARDMTLAAHVRKARDGDDASPRRRVRKIWVNKVQLRTQRYQALKNSARWKRTNQVNEFAADPKWLQASKEEAQVQQALLLLRKFVEMDARSRPQQLSKKTVEEDAAVETSTSRSIGIGDSRQSICWRHKFLEDALIRSPITEAKANLEILESLPPASRR